MSRGEDWVVLSTGRIMLHYFRDGCGALWIVVPVGSVTVAALLPVVRFGHAGWWRRAQHVCNPVADWPGVHDFRGRGVFSGEESQMMAGLVGGTVMYLIAAVVLTVLAKLLKLHDGQEPAIERGSFGMAISMILWPRFPMSSTT